MKLNLQQKNKFKKNGFLVVDIFSKKELQQFENAVLYLIETQALKANKRNAKIKLSKSKLTSSVLMELDKFNHDFIADISDFLPNMTESIQLLANKKFVTHIRNKETIIFM